ncbi:exocyst complex component 5-like [Varroa jacobsoni]|uniref:Exocyst complex component 5 n=1 Tax=Varroa destructor TaxID=109461 RepID=A0A7M7KA72_VARDE|nr:exocyst complex component 5-like [Varroa destructor]XP_022663857.1 exocyst complex component 5-like [Varroa destructor]XP_022663858.1 exocyst complex component 5-like [Varroa destructor]XP_022691625.1 exocyst complex component 5-like [Varroa jacobsoni]
MSFLIAECEAENFCAEDLVERFAWRTLGPQKDDRFDAKSLEEAFRGEIEQLRLEYDHREKRCQRLEKDCSDEMERHWRRVEDLLDKNKQSQRTYKNLDTHIGRVAAKVVYLGDLLESVNTPRARAEEAEKLMLKFADFQSEVSDVPLSKQNIYENSDLIQKLHLIAQELPSGGKFDEAKARITTKYSQIESDLIDEFRNAHEIGDVEKMIQLESILAHFKGFQTCVDTFITDAQRGAYIRSDVFQDIIPLCRNTQNLVVQVFNNPNQIMAKFITHVYTVKLQDYITIQLQVNDRGDYLSKLLLMHTSTEKLSEELTKFKIDYSLLQKLSRQIFQKDLDGYINVEMQFLRERLDHLLKRYYEDLDHVKRSAGALQDLRRDMQAFIKPLANINIAPVAEDFGGETFLSETLAANMLQELRQSLGRCRVLSRQSDRSKNACQIWHCLQSRLCVEHIQYALDLGLRCIPLSETKAEPRLTFLDCVRECNTMVHLLDDLFCKSVAPLIASSPEYGTQLQKKRECFELMEQKMQHGIELCLQAMMGWIRELLNEQRRTPMNPTETSSSPTCARVCRYVNDCTSHIQRNLDGQNCIAVLTEFGIQFHRAIYEHILTMQYDPHTTAYIIMCDVSEYRACARQLPAFIDRLFEVLSILVNLLMTPHNKLQDLLNSHALKQLDPQVLQSFVELRTDCKQERLVQTYFKARK